MGGGIYTTRVKKKAYHEFDLFDICKRCGRSAQDIAEYKLDCLSDAEIEAAAQKRVDGLKAFDAFKRLRRK